ncbi:hypothetical protein [Ramlibacter sp. AN1133]|uniref:hypothetical protein n=1 Tax=Ramlibacter sp. AN1133 TaxID=3133429 RepID=UPI0030BDA149
MEPTPKLKQLKQPDQISITFLAIVDGASIPSQLKLGDHSMEFLEAEHFGQSLITAAYGAHSKQVVLQMASEWNRLNENKQTGRQRALLIDAFYRVDNFQEFNKGLATRTSVEATGFLHFDRVMAEMRDEIRADWLEWIEADFANTREHKRLSEMGLVQIALEHPRYVARMITKKRSPRYQVVVHPVHPARAPQETLWVATMRYDKDRIVNPVLRFMAGTQVIV